MRSIRKKLNQSYNLPKCAGVFIMTHAKKRRGNRPETSPFFQHNNFCWHRMEIKHNSMTIFSPLLCASSLGGWIMILLWVGWNGVGEKSSGTKEPNRNKDSNRRFRRKEKQKKIELSCVRVRWICSDEFSSFLFILIKTWIHLRVIVIYQYLLDWIFTMEWRWFWKKEK